jgi:hypothetical protein
MIKNYKKCRIKAEGLGKVFVLKFNKPNAVLFSIREYKKIAESLDQIERQDDMESAKVKDVLP